jgi:hypothetical protein
MDHQHLEGAGNTSQATIDTLLPTAREKNIIAKLAAQTPPESLTGARDDPEQPPPT